MQTEEIANEPVDGNTSLALDLASFNYTECDSFKSVTSYSVYAKSTIEVAANADVFSGNVGVKDRLSAPVPGGLPGQLTVRGDATLSPGESALANSIRLASSASAGTLYLNTGGGGTTVEIITPFPAASMPSIPAVADVPYADEVTTVFAHSFTTLDEARDYGEVIVQEGGTLYLDAVPRPGDEVAVFNFQKIRMANGSSIIANVPVIVGIRESLLTSGQNITIGPSAGLTAKDFVIRTNAVPKLQTGGSEIPVVRISGADLIDDRAEVRALLIAPRGLIDIGRNAHWVGAITGDRILIRQHGAIDFEDGINDGTCKVICDTVETDLEADDLTKLTRVSPLGNLPEAEYIVKYVEGCMKYARNYRWSLNAIVGQFSWQLVAEAHDEFLFDLPGTEGFNVPAANQATPYVGFKTYEECVAANAALPAEIFSHAGGPVGVHLNDNPAYDNTATRALPKWSLTRVGQYSCDSPEN